MGTKTLTITEEAYERLRGRKRPDESFTDTILRITDPERDPMAGFGAMNDVEGFREAVEDTRGLFDEDLRGRGQRRDRDHVGNRSHMRDRDDDRRGHRDDR